MCGARFVAQSVARPCRATREAPLPRPRRGRPRPRPGADRAGPAADARTPVARGRLRPLRSTIPAVTPTAWSSFLTGLNPAGHGIFNFSTNPNRGPQRVESAASRAGTPLWRLLGERRHPLGVRRDPVHLPGRADRRHRRHRLRRPEQPQILPAAARGADPRGPPRARDRAPPDGRALVGGLRGLRRQARRARRRRSRTSAGSPSSSSLTCSCSASTS